MPQSEIAFLLRVLNKEFPEGRVNEDHPYSLMQAMIIDRGFQLGVWFEHHPDKCLWYAHVNDESGRWED